MMAILGSVAIYSTTLFFAEPVADVLYDISDPMLQTNFKNIIQYETRLFEWDTLKHDHDHFFEKIRQTPEYEAFMEKYPSASLVYDRQGDFENWYALYYSNFTSPSIIKVNFYYNVQDNSFGSYYQCRVGEHQDQYDADITYGGPVTYWIVHDECETRIAYVDKLYDVMQQDKVLDILFETLEYREAYLEYKEKLSYLEKRALDIKDNDH